MSAFAMNVKGSDSDVEISRENQRKINLFAIRNGWLEELNDELKVKQNSLKNLEDAEADVMLNDDGMGIFIGEAFVHFEQERGLEMVASLMAERKAEVAELEAKVRGVKAEMEALKKELYGAFGDSINLEVEEEA